MAKKSGLGRGYEALMSDNATEQTNAVEVRIDELEPNPDQPRKNFDKNALDELSENIKKYGLIQPIVVRQTIMGTYQIVAGERRWRASMQAGLKTVPVIIKELTDAETMEIAIIENLQREDLNPIETAKGFKSPMDEFSLTQEEVAEKVGKSRSAVANALRLLDLGKYIIYVENGTISAGHARAMLPLSEEMREIAVEMIKKGATVRDIETLSKKKPINREKGEKQQILPTYYKEVEISLKSELGRKVEIKQEKNKCTLSIDFFGEQDLKDLIKTLFK
ncbi:MAG: ParB/RepB/Spo0J family partition protein [Clostridia bacterium]|nr:ParB/RepB/Spo0J family partition protein [Clostridia bacterium]